MILVNKLDHVDIENNTYDKSTGDLTNILVLFGYFVLIQAR